MTKQPHVVLLMGDQMRFDCLSAYGKLGVKTPNIDALAAESVVFERAYCATPLCVPTRIAIAAGKWPHKTGAIVNGSLRPEEKPFGTLLEGDGTYLEQLEKGGYRIQQAGVQHLRTVPAIEKRVPGAEFVYEGDWVKYLKGRGYELPPDDRGRRPCPEWADGQMWMKAFHSATDIQKTEYGAEDFMDMWWARQVCERIEKADVSQPRAWIYNGWAPHPPTWVPEPYFSMYDPAKIELPENVGRWYPGQPAFLLHTSTCKAAQLHREEWRRIWAAYFGLVTLQDACIGRIVQALKERGIWDEALVIFTMDHGENLGAHCLSGKQVMYEESARVPLFIKPPASSAPGSAGGSACAGVRQQIANHVDLAATICEYAGVEPPAGQQGRSLKAVVENAGAAWEDATFADYHGEQGRSYPTRCIFTSRYKYIYHFCGPDELYDVVEDPMEMKSLANDAAFAGVKAKLKGRLARWMKETGDFMDMEKDAGFEPRMWKEVGLRIRSKML
ncbi:MAG: sulfatase-like hydrolase/transferase [Phycisphaerales bacterium]|nr:sulfatase-like hydrolase/transferase [Phycisphaerales bacterium]